jgi:hypothetical protein
MNALRDFVPGSWPVPQTPVSLNGLRDFVAGKYPVPQVPVVTTAGMNSLVPSSPTGMVIPNNSVMAAWNGAGMSGLGCGDSCGCGGKCGGGMGQLSLTSITAPFTTAFTDVQTAISTGSISSITGEDWLVIGGSAAALWLLFGKKGRR